MFFKIGILKNFANFRGKYLSWSLFSIVTGAQACNFIKRRLQDRCFSCKICEIVKNTFSYRTPPVAASETNWFNIETTCSLFTGDHSFENKVQYRRISDLELILKVKVLIKWPKSWKSWCPTLIINTTHIQSCLFSISFKGFLLHVRSSFFRKMFF